MNQRTARFDLAVRGLTGAVVTSLVDVTRSGLVVAADLPIEEGAVVQVNADSPSRRSVALTVVDSDGTLTPRVGADSLAPFGNELVLSTGFRFTDTTVERLPVGIFRVTDAESSEGQVQLVGSDRSIVVREAKFESPYVITSGTEVSAAIQALISSRYPGLTYVAVTTGYFLPLTVFEEGERNGDPWSNAQTLAAAAGLEVFFDVLGRVVIQPVPNPTAESVVWTYEPAEDSILIDGSVANRLSSGQTKNVAVVSAEGTGVGTPIRASAEITDPTNPIFPGGAFGRRPDFSVTSLATTAEQVQAAADARLLEVAGGGELTGFAAVGHPAHEAGDVVAVVSSLVNTGSTLAVLSAFNLPLDLRSQVGYTTRGRRSS